MFNCLLAESNIGQIFVDLFQSMGFMDTEWQKYIMLLISFVLMFLAIVKKFEPMLLLPIAFGMFLINLPGAEPYLWGTHPIEELTLGVSGNVENVAVYIDPQYLNAGLSAAELQAHYIFARSGYIGYFVGYSNLVSGMATFPTGTYTFLGYIQCGIQNGATVFNQSFDYSIITGIVNESFDAVVDKGLLWYLYFGVDKVIYPPLIFLGIGCMTDFGPLIANPKSMLIGAGAQLGIFIAFILAILLGFSAAEAASIAIIGGADGPTAIMVTSKLASDFIPMIAIAAYSYMALIPIIQKPLMRLLTTKKERTIRMKQLRQVSKIEKVLFPIIVTLVVGIILPSSIPLLGMLMLGNLFRESGVVERLSSQAQNGLMNTITIFLGVSVGCKAKGSIFLTPDTLYIILLGLFAFVCGTIGGLLVAKIMCKITKGKINPLIGSAGVSAVPMAARISEDVGREYDPQNHLLMHAMGPNVAGVIGSAIAAGILLACFGGKVDGTAAVQAIQSVLV
ncbi:MAG: sodium ion-translocating decarboxylase subunit beta [Clostridia bacterium]|nr:sodium ion-translocating decarboxylase subunit beta [Clostridia bacterium]